MGKRRRTQPAATGKTHGVINGAGEVVEQNIDSTIRENYMPYAMSVIPVSYTHLDVYKRQFPYGAFVF